MADTADQDAAALREAGLKAAADALAAQRAAQDEATAQQRLAEDEALADKRTAEDRALASSRARLGVAAAAVSAAVAAVSADVAPDDPHAADLRTANAELQGALADHLDLVPDPPAEGTAAA
jgi:colicin import membrane protein